MTQQGLALSHLFLRMVALHCPPLTKSCCIDHTGPVPLYLGTRAASRAPQSQEHWKAKHPCLGCDASCYNQGSLMWLQCAKGKSHDLNQTRLQQLGAALKKTGNRKQHLQQAGQQFAPVRALDQPVVIMITSPANFADSYKRLQLYSGPRQGEVGRHNHGRLAWFHIPLP